MESFNQKALPRFPVIYTDIVIIGAGPIGIELAVLLKRAGINYIHFDAKQIGHSISQWPARTRFFSSPERVALAGVPLHTQNQESVTGERYLAYLRSLVELFDLEIHTYEPVIDVGRKDDGTFIVSTKSSTGLRQYVCRRVVMAVGNVNHPRRLNIVGENQPFVHHRLADPHTYFKKRVLIVGGKNSALEAVLRCWRVGANVSLSYRREEFETSIVKPHLSREVNLLIEKKQIRYYPGTRPKMIEPGWAAVEYVEDQTKSTRIPIDFVLFCIGYEAEVTLFQKAGVLLLGEEKRPYFDPDTMETNVPGLYVCGTAAGGTQSKHDLFISTCHHQVEKVMRDITGLEPSTVGAVPTRKYSVTFEDVQQD